jgi:peptidoglycan pentaglycine glycine transferase (the first glycine)
MQPRYTFRINLDRPMTEIENNFSKTVKQRINKGTSLGTTVRIGTVDDIEEFSKLMMMTEDRKEFVSHDMKYYKDLYEIYNKYDNMNLFIGSINTTKVINEYEKEKAELLVSLNRLNEKDGLSTANQKKKKELEMRIKKLDEYIKEYSDARDKYGEEIVLNSHVIIEYGDKAWTLYAGNHNVLSSSQSNYKVYYEHIKYCHDQGIKYYDHFGTVGDLNSKNPRYGLHVFKKSFGGNYIEFIGEFDYVTNPFMYFCFTKLVPLYRKIIKRRAQKKLSKSINNRSE